MLAIIMMAPTSPSCPASDTARQAAILIASAYPVLRAGLRVLLETEPDFRVVGEAGDGEGAVRLVREIEPDILLLDFHMPRHPKLEVLRELGKLSMSVRTILLAEEAGTSEILEAFQLGARGIVLKQSVTEVLFECIRGVMAGRYWIPQEKTSDIVLALHSLYASQQRRRARLWPEFPRAGRGRRGCGALHEQRHSGHQDGNKVVTSSGLEEPEQRAGKPDPEGPSSAHDCDVQLG